MEFNATFLVSIISFLVFMKIMNAIFYIPLTSVIEDRECVVNENNEHAQKNNDKADAILQEKENRLTQTAKETRQILIDKTNAANSMLKTRTDEARNSASLRANELKNALIKSENDAREELSNKTEELAQVIVNKVLGGLNG